MHNFLSSQALAAVAVTSFLVFGSACGSDDSAAARQPMPSDAASLPQPDAASLPQPDAASLPQPDAAHLPQDASSPAPTIDPTSFLMNAGFAVAHGSLVVFDTSKCCVEGNTCYMNNATSPYMLASVPPAAGQTAPDPSIDGTHPTAWRMREDEAVVFWGKTPPKASYFGFTHYVFDREVRGSRKEIFASLGESLNFESAHVNPADGPGTFDHRIAIIMTANKTVEASVTDALVQAGVPASAINLLVFDPADFTMGIEDAADTFSLMLRIALPEDPTAMQQYLTDPDVQVMRVTPTVPVPAAPEVYAASRPKDFSDSEKPLEPYVDQLEAALIAANPGYAASVKKMSFFTANPERCIERNTSCLGDSRDTLYPQSKSLFVSDPDDFFVVYGVNHAATGKATYSNIVVGAVDQQIGVASRTNTEYQGSATAYLPGVAQASSLYAVKIARSCPSGDAACIPIPEAACPTGVAAGAPVIFASRLYVEPGQATAADPSTVVLDRVLRFTKN